MKQLRKIFAAAVLVTGLALPIGLAPASFAQAPIEDACSDSGAVSAICNDTDADIQSVIGIIVNTLLFIVGVISVIMIIIGGIRYTTSGGDTGAVTSAKNTILYAVIGLIVSFIAFAVVNWVIDLF
ncbi:hypothetical protein CL689_00920 [Candidatus Saccharibacteria bacterium]|nr:hypothetical protein [Candidatus Saccharibacteria bacterium]MBQ68612.1 hypothetical protein [Candidatus Saccharibacteria bacterium]|tara:strand:+ start:2607 stop:2984 length:378 start_codon:yes stop_codon:yes gene_type:complete